MKLRNKRTGEIKEWDFGSWYQHILNPDNKESYECTLSEFIDRTVKFREVWQDYEEPKEYWFIDEYGMVQQEIDYYYDENKSAVHDKRLEVGNYFETKEEAEKAVEKLKAWKRLKDKGFSIYSWDYEGFGMKVEAGRISFEIDKDCNEDKDLDLLFGGEE